MNHLQSLTLISAGNAGDVSSRTGRVLHYSLCYTGRRRMASNDPVGVMEQWRRGLEPGRRQWKLHSASLGGCIRYHFISCARSPPATPVSEWGGGYLRCQIIIEICPFASFLELPRAILRAKSLDFSLCHTHFFPPTQPHLPLHSHDSPVQRLEHTIQAD